MSRVFSTKAAQLWAERIAPSGQAHFRGERRLLPVSWPDGPQTVKANQRGNKANQTPQA